VNNRANAKTEKELFIELAGKASCLLGTQDGRHFVSCIRVLGPSIYLTTFHRSGSISTCSYNINFSPLQFLRILIGVSFSDYLTIGFDMSIKWHIWGQDTESNISVSEHSDEPQLESESDMTDDHASPLDSEGALCPGSESSDTGSWELDNEEAEQNDEHSQERKGNKWVEITDMHSRHFTVWLKSVLAISDGLVGQGTTVWEGEIDPTNGDKPAVVVKDSWIDPLRKYTEGMILHILEQHHIEGIPTLVSEEQVETQLRTPDHPHPVVNSSTHFLFSALPSDTSFHLCLLSRLVTRPVCNLILEFSSLGELLVTFLDYTVGELMLLKICSPNSPV
jgi:hypothetical protein